MIFDLAADTLALYRGSDAFDRGDVFESTPEGPCRATNPAFFRDRLSRTPELTKCWQEKSVAGRIFLRRVTRQLLTAFALTRPDREQKACPRRGDSQTATTLREAVGAYSVARKEQARAKNRFRSLLRSRGVTKLDGSIYEPSMRPKWIGKLPPAYRRRAEWLGQQCDATTEAHEVAESWLKEEAQKCPEVQRLETVPGLGDIRATQIVAIVVTPHRFRKTRQFWSYCGLGIVTRASSKWKRDANGHKLPSTLLDLKRQRQIGSPGRSLRGGNTYRATCRRVA